jgi:hypothetical protein
MKCPKCQIDNPDNKKFCRECAHDLRTALAETLDSERIHRIFILAVSYPYNVSKNPLVLSPGCS